MFFNGEGEKLFDKKVFSFPLYIDSMEGDPALVMDVGFTTHWEAAQSGWVPFNLTVPAGVHTLYLAYASTEAGSVSELVFMENVAGAATEAVEEETTAPETFDAGVLAVVTAFISAAAYVVSKKRSK